MRMLPRNHSPEYYTQGADTQMVLRSFGNALRV